MTPTAVLLFAAGLGTRMAPLTNTKPKPLVDVAEKPLLDHALDQCGDLKTVVNAHYFSDQIIDHIKGRDISLSDETDELLETGGGLKRALPLLNSDPVFTMNTDAVWRGPNPIETLFDAWDGRTTDALLLMIPRDNAVGHTGAGDFAIAPDGQLSRGGTYVYSGVQIIKTGGLDTIKKTAFSMWELWDRMLARGTMRGVVYDGQWCDVGRPDCIPLAEDMLRGDLDV